jgi:hypothetical protein
MENDKLSVIDLDVNSMYWMVMRYNHTIDELIEYYDIRRSFLGEKNVLAIVNVMAETQIKYGDIERIPEREYEYEREYQNNWLGSFL